MNQALASMLSYNRNPHFHNGLVYGLGIGLTITIVFVNDGDWDGTGIFFLILSIGTIATGLIREWLTLRQEVNNVRNINLEELKK